MTWKAVGIEAGLAQSGWTASRKACSALSLELSDAEMIGMDGQEWRDFMYKR